MTINIQSSNSTYTNKGSQVFEREVTFSGALTVSGGITLNTSPLTLSSNYIVENLENGTSDSTLKAYGVSVINPSTGGGAMTVGLAAPIIGVRKVICVTANTTETVTVDATSDVVIGNSTALSANKLVFTGPGLVELVGVTTARYMVLTLGSTLWAGTTTLPTFSS